MFANLDWKMLAIIVVIVIAITIINKRAGVTWSGKKINVEGIDVEYKLDINISDRSYDQNDSTKNRPSKILLGMSAQKGFDYQLSAENIGNQILKTVGAKKDIEIRIPEFDDKVVINSKQGNIENQLSVNTDLREAILFFFESGEAFDAKFISLQHRSGKLWLEYRPKPTFKEKQFVNNLSQAVVNLNNYKAAIK